MDYRLPGMDGVEATAAVLRAYPGAAVIGLTASANVRERQAMSEAGGVDCLSKDDELAALVAAIHRAAGLTPAGEPWSRPPRKPPSPSTRPPTSPPRPAPPPTGG